MSRAGEASEPGEAGCRLLLAAPDTDLAPLVPALERAVSIEAVVGLIVDGPKNQDAAWSEAAATLRERCHARACAFFVAWRPEVARALGAEGALVGGAASKVKTARAMLGKDGIIGAHCGNARHNAMLAGEAGADYVSVGEFDGIRVDDLPAIMDNVAWWHDLCVLPQAVAGVGSPDQGAALSQAGADFVVPAPALWHESDGGTARLVEFADAIGSA